MYIANKPAKSLFKDERIHIDHFMSTLSTFTFDMLRHSDFSKIFPESEIQNKEMYDDTIELTIDDYVFTINRILPDESTGSVYRLNDSVSVSKIATVWLSEDDVDFECTGTIKYDNDAYYMTVELDVL